MAAKWDRVKEVFQSALARVPEERSRFLSDACGDDAELRREVESLLAAHAEAGSFGERAATVDSASVLTPQWMLGSYRIVEKIGAGGMGEVYRAHDTTLGRDVALKVLPRELSADADRVARLEREARVLASLNHPHIAAIHGFEEGPAQSGHHVRALVLELVEGPTLAERLARGPLRLEEALRIAQQIADALAAAHDKGIIHRDLKPANVKFTAQGQVKVLDFGLAKPFAAGGLEHASGLASVTTVEGVLAGTPAYMSPEQARGQAVDKRTDIWALGCVLYEMLTGTAAFTGDTITDVLAQVIERDPDWSQLPETTPSAIRRALRRCLERDSGRRFHDARDLWLDLEEALAERVPIAAGKTAGPFSRDRIGLVTATAVLAASAAFLVAGLYLQPVPDAVPATRFPVSPPQGWALAVESLGGPTVNPMAVSPDGRHIALVLRNAVGRTRIWIRAIDTLEVTELAGTDGGRSPFWSPDSRWLAFFADGKLKKVALDGGQVVPLCDVVPGVSGTWGADDVIIYAPRANSRIWTVSANGGTPSPATMWAEGEIGHTRPYFLPDGRRFLYRALLTLPTSNTRGPIYVGEVGSAERTHVLDADSTNVLYAQGHLLFVRDTALVAQPFDSDRLELTGAAFQIAEQILTFGLIPLGYFSASDTGVLAYQTKSADVGPQLTWIHRSGKVLATVGDRRLYREVQLSSDGRTAATDLYQAQGGNEVWLVDLERIGAPSRQTFNDASDRFAIWSPDDDQLVFTSSRGRQEELYLKRTTATAEELISTQSPGAPVPTSWSRDGFLLYTAVWKGPEQLWVHPMSAGGKPFQILSAPVARRVQGQFSPDGRSVAYASNESGPFDVYVAPFDAQATGVLISTGGGYLPRWNSDGTELFYVQLGRDAGSNPTLMAATLVRERGRVRVVKVTELFSVRPAFPIGPGQSYFYDVAPDDERFLVNVGPELELKPSPITVIVNWMAALKK